MIGTKGATKTSEMAGLHDDVAKKLRTLIADGETEVRAGKEIKRPVSAAVLAVARGFLKDNNIQCDDGEPTRPVGELGKAVAAMNEEDDAIPEFPN
jgi:hypothetical protein